MKLIITQKNLNKGLSICEKVIGRNLTLPILQNVLLSCEKNKGYLKLSATDLEVGIEILIPAKLENEGVSTVPAKVFSDFIHNLPDEKVELENKNSQLSIICGNFQSLIKTEPSKEFPIIPNMDGGDVIYLKTDDFIKGLSSVVGSVSALDIKPEISGVYINFDKDVIYFVGTDSFRLSERKIEQGNDINGKVILPRKTTDIILRSLEDLSENVRVEFSDNQMVVFSESKETPGFKVRIVSRVIDGDYPNYEQILPTSFSTFFNTKKDTLIKHVKAASIFSSKINDITFKLNPKKGEVIIISKDQEFGNQSSIVPGEIEGEEMDVTFNFNYLIDGINSISSQDISIKFNKDNTPALISSPEDKSFKYVLMPIKN